MRRWVILWLVAVSLAATSVDAGDLDLVPFARVTASATADTFLGLWPRETDDAPYTVRDGDAETSWKIPAGGPHHLIVDFAPGDRRAPAIERIEAEWTKPPAGKVEIAMFDACGGNFVFRTEWSDPTAPLALANPVRAQCVVLSVSKAKNAALAELRIFSGASDAPAIANAAAEPLDDGWRVTYESTNDAVHHVRVSFRAVADKADDLFVVNAPPNGPCDLPRPVIEGHAVVLTPIAQDGAVGAEHVLEIHPKPAVPFAASGIVEGFYGRPWSHEERRRMILLLGRLDQGIYIYGPKNDPLHRDEWRTPYGDDAIARFAELQELSAMVGVTMSFGISPGKDMDLDDPDERGTLVAKLAPFVEVGYRHFTLLFDDIEFGLETPIDAAMGAAHVDLCNWLRGELTALAGDDVTLWMVPTV
ncbi:MAG: beta-N-acetylglucosaminidase domain-containing protein [Deltaproteobacteria bacterium]|nr:beta-N-acetylglucosaminidase domain-containing protein [Deltaproteobacteria bacterium]